MRKQQERSQARDNASDKHDVQDAMENIEAGRIRFSELTLGSLLGSGSFADVRPLSYPPIHTSFLSPHPYQSTRVDQHRILLPQHRILLPHSRLCARVCMCMCMCTLIGGHAHMRAHIHTYMRTRGQLWPTGSVDAGHRVSRR